MTAPITHVAAIILAAGSSSRMGRPKQLLQVGGRTVLERAVESVRRSGIREVVLVLGSNAARIERELPAEVLDGVKIVLNPDYERGMAGSLGVGLAAVGGAAAAALVVLGDQPLVRPETLRRIAQAGLSADREIVIPEYHGQRGNPVRIGREFFAEAMALKGDTGCRALFVGHTDEIERVLVDDEGILLDIDEPGDYENLRGRGL